MKVHYKGVYLKRKKLASGQVRIYYYDRQTGARLPDDPSSSAFLLELERLRRTKNSAVPAERTYAHLIREYRQSLGYTRLKASTRKEYDRHIRYLEEVLAMFPVKDIRRKHIEKIMSKFADKPTLAIAIKRTLSVMMTYAQDRLEWIDFNPCQGMERQRLRGTVGQRPYSEEEIAQFRAANPFGTRARLIFETALGTALRISDIPKIPYHAFLSGEVHILTNKTGAFVVAGVTEQMREAWMAWEKTRRMHSDVDVQFAICSLEGKKLHKRTLSEDMEEAYIRAGFDASQRTHALRYTASVRMLESGFSYDDIAELTGHRMAAMAKKYTEKRRSAQVRVRVFNAIDAEAASVRSQH